MAKHYILVDADFIDTFAFDFTVLAERELCQRVKPANLGLWLDCIALDGGLRPGENEVQVAFLHNKDTEGLKHFLPGNFAKEIDGKAFQDNLGEFVLATCPVETVVTKADLFVQSMKAWLETLEDGVLMLVPDMQSYGTQVLQAMAETKGRIMLFTTEKVAGRGFEQELISYSIAHALGITQ